MLPPAVYTEVVAIWMLAPELMHGIIRDRAGLRHVLEAAAQRVVVADAGPVDAHGGINGRLDIFRVDVAALRPAVVGSVGTGGIGLTDDGPAFNPTAGEEGELLRPVIP